MFEMTENEFNECEQAERIKHDEKVKELEAQNKNLQEMLQATRETRVNADYLKKIAELEAQIEKMKCCINDLVHLGEFNEYTDEEYFNYQVHEALKNAGQFIKEIKEND